MQSSTQHFGRVREKLLRAKAWNDPHECKTHSINAPVQHILVF